MSESPDKSGGGKGMITEKGRQLKALVLNASSEQQTLVCALTETWLFPHLPTLQLSYFACPLRAIVSLLMGADETAERF